MNMATIMHYGCRVMRWYIHIVGVLIVLLILSACAAGGMSKNDRLPLVPVRELLLNQATYPPGWAEEKVLQNMEYPSNYIENVGIELRYHSEDTSVSTHTVFRYASPDEAQAGYDALNRQDEMFYPNLSPRKELTYTSQIAQKMSILCYDRAESSNRTIPFCVVLARYGVYVSVFTSPIDNRYMSFIDFKRLLDEIDKKMVVIASG